MNNKSSSLSYRLPSLLALVSIMVLFAACTTWFVLPLMPESAPAARGATGSVGVGCLSCHGQPSGRHQVDAPAMCARKSTKAVRPDSHPLYEGSCRDLLAFFESLRTRRAFEQRVAEVSDSRAAENRLLSGERLARKYYCFQCHGELGQGGYPNAGALKGYIPGYFGDDFKRLTNGGEPQSIESWIRHGIDSRLFEHPIKGAIARFFIERQAIQMPKFDKLTDNEIDLLVDYVRTLHTYGPMDAMDIRHYRDRATQRP